MSPLATLPTDQTAGVGTAISDAVSQALTVVSSNLPLVFGVAIAFVAWKVGRRILGHI